MNSPSSSGFRNTLSSLIFLSRWLQAPLYLGLILAQVVYVWHFMVELWHLIQKTPGIAETEIMLIVLGLIDVVMIANLLIMVIIGGYETFVSRLSLDGHPDQPEWLSHVNAGVLKVKLATALIGISSIHLLKSFINAKDVTVQMNTDLFWQVTIHVTFLVSALFLALIDKLTSTTIHVPSQSVGHGGAGVAGAEKDASVARH
ncbi:MAG: TIGR00645 family protein [Verrucomicrobium sp.]|nr:TIGR00645 family protein [Verrucomicrobium sp.]